MAKIKAEDPTRHLRPSRAGYYILIFGWLTLPISIIFSLEWVDYKTLFDKFISAEPLSIAFRAIALFVPLVFTVLAYVVNKRERFLWMVIAKERKLEFQQTKLQSNLRQLSDKLTEQEKAAPAASGEIKGFSANVKNSISLVSAFVEFHIQNTDPVTQRALKSSQRRIRAISMAYDAISRSDSAGFANTKDYLKAVAEDLMSTQGKGDDVKLSLNLKGVMMDSNELVACGLIVSELVSNSLMHGFSGVEDPVVTVALTGKTDNDLVLKVSDNGTGTPADLDLNYLKTLGLRIVSKMAKQLGATHERSTTSGTSNTFSFKL